MGVQPVSSVVFVITMNCNLRCTYPCFVPHNPRRATRAVCEALVDWLVRQPSPQVDIGFFGGEPFLEWELMRHTMEYGRERAARLGKTITWSVTTNGTLLDEKKVEALCEYRCGVLLSIDGPKEIHDRCRVDAQGRGSFDRTMRGAEILLAHKDKLMYLTARVTWNPEAHQEGRALVEFFTDLGFPSIAICPVEEADFERVLEPYRKAEREIADFFIERTRQGKMPPLSFTTRYLGMIYNHRVLNDFRPEYRTCGAGKGMLGCDPDGGLFPCHRFAQTPALRKYRLGDVWSGLDEEERIKFQDLCLYHMELPFDCKKCPAWPYCTPPCMGVNGDFTGSLWKSVRGHCVWHRVHVPECERIHRELLDCDYYHEMARKGFGEGGCVP